MAEVSLGVKIWGDVNQLLTSLKKAEKELNSFLKKMSSVGKELSTSLSLPLVGFGAFAVSEFGKAAQASASLESQLRSNGKNVASTMADYNKFASELQRLTTVEDDVSIGLLQVAESMKAPDPKKAVQDAIGLAKAFGMDLNNAVSVATKAQMGQYQMLGRMLPAVKAAKTQTEKAAIANKFFADSFNIATAQAKTGLGPLEQMKNELGNISEGFGEIILNALNPFLVKIKEVAQWMGNLSDGTKKWVVGISLIAAAIGPVLFIVGKLPGVLATVIQGFNLMISTVQKLWVFLINNPYVAVAAAIVAVGVALYMYSQRASEAERAQKALNDVNQTALSNTVKERVEVDGLLRIAQNETLSKEQRRKAIAQLNAISPEYLGNLRLENINTQDAKKSTDQYIQSLILKAKVQAAQEKLVDIQKKLLDLQNGTSEAAKTSIWQDLGNAISSFGNAGLFAINSTISSMKNAAEETAALKAEQDSLTGIIDQNTNTVLSNASALGTGAGEAGKEKSEIEKLNAQITLHEALLQKAIVTKKGNALAIGQEIAALKEQKTLLEAQALALSTPRDKNPVAKIQSKSATGIPLPQNENIGTQITQYGNLLKMYTDVITALEKGTVEQQTFGTGMGNAAMKADFLKQKISELIQAGYSPQSAQIQNLVNKYKELENQANVTQQAMNMMNNSPMGNLLNNVTNIFNAFKSIGTGIKQISQGVTGAFKDVASGIGAAVMGGLDIWNQLSSQHYENELAKIDNYYNAEKERIQNSAMTAEQKAAAQSKLDKKVEKERKEMMIKQAKQQKAAALIQAVIAGALAVIQALSAGPIIGIVLAAIVGALAAVQIGLIASQPIPALAGGGLASSPTLAMVGDNPNAMIDPEVIAPISKLKEYMGTNVQEVVVYGRLSGNDILISNENSSRDRSRIRGF